MIKLSDYVMKFVAAQGVQHVFMLSGGGCMHLVDSLGRQPQLKYVCNLHEQACAIAADACAQYTNNIGIALITTGPGGTNTVTGVAGSWLDSIPVLFISGQVKRADLASSRGVRQMGFQEIDIVSVVQPITKYAVMITDPGTIRYHLEKAVWSARSGRPGPVWIDIPLDVQAAMIDESTLPTFDVQETGTPPEAVSLEEQVKESFELLQASERPAILVGNGVRLAGAVSDFLRLIEILKIPVLTTWKAIDFLPDSHSLYVGRPGAVGQRGANFVQQNSDCLLILGARLDFGQTGYNHANFARAAAKIMVDVDSREIQKMNTPIHVPVHSDARAFIREFLLQSAGYEIRDRTGWLSRCKQWQAKYPVVLPEYWEEQGYVNQYALIDVISEAMSGEDLLVPGSSGACSEVTMQAFRVKQGMRIFNSQGLGSMGFGIPAALGGCVASGGKRTISVDGDGGFFMNIQELETIARLNLPIKFFVLNNKGYGSIRATQRNYFQGLYVGSNEESGLTLPSITKVAESYGISSCTLANMSSMRERVRAILDQEGPVICEVMLSPDAGTMPKLASAQKSDGSMVSRPLEDLWPFLDREEFGENMIIPILED
jgi:acetolactate synthase I/II/III large subunit